MKCVTSRYGSGLRLWARSKGASRCSEQMSEAGTEERCIAHIAEEIVMRPERLLKEGIEVIEHELLAEWRTLWP